MRDKKGWKENREGSKKEVEKKRKEDKGKRMGQKEERGDIKKRQKTEKERKKEKRGGQKREQRTKKKIKEGGGLRSMRRGKRNRHTDRKVAMLERRAKKKRARNEKG